MEDHSLELLIRFLPFQDLQEEAVMHPVLLVLSEFWLLLQLIDEPSLLLS